MYEKLRNARRAMRLKQAELGKALGLPQGYISQVESGKHDIKLSTMQDWARVLGFELMLIPIAEVKSISYLLEANTTELLPPAYGPLPEHPQ